VKLAVGGEAQFATLRDEWHRLLARSESRTIFLTWEWAAAWWRAYGSGGELSILTARDESGRLIGIAPLQKRKQRRYGQTVDSLSFIGDASNDSDYLDFIVEAGREREVIEAFASRWSSEVDRGVVVLLNEVPETSPNLPILREFGISRGWEWKETASPCATVSLPDNWNDYLRNLKPRFRTKVRSVLRMLEERGDVKWGFCASAEEARNLHPALFDLHTRRWRADGKPGVFWWDRKREFYDALSPLLADGNWLRFSYLEWRGKPLACQYGFVYDGIYSHLQEGYEPASEHWNLGIGLRAWTVRRFIEEGIREYDFLGGVGRHKADWGTRIKTSKSIVLARPRLGTALYRRGPEWDEYARGIASSLIPAPVLEARKRRLLAKASVSGPEAAQPDSPDWIHRSAATMYSRVAAHLIPRSFRRDFEIKVNGRNFPRLKRRRGPSGRILYYHRITDEQDPFFLGMSTALFRAQMEVLARHHTVVPVRDMVKHLTSGATGCVVAITFDDGYEDNYRNAFPILADLGLPATIFLTTGALDSQEPLWFEQLAWAFKMTNRESVDLELDVPRRLPLTSLKCRLQANGAVFSALRRLPDAERRRELANILSALAAPEPAERRGRMLTWDMVRAMSRGGVDFGGHTVTHPFVSKLTPDDGVHEIAGCKQRIEEELQTSVELFAYPNGREEDFASWNKAVLRDAGYAAAVSTIWGMNDSSTDLMELRRGQPWEPDLQSFIYKLDWYQLANA
jgi:peptidoglycan/xylan/chitin deacetylase (PgdA/CDA1 family)/CelD/BcsL family acetyltransferase involved in cellulose biosynthesis